MDEKRSKNLKTAFAATLAVLLILCFAFMLHAWRAGHFASPQALREYLSGFGIWAPLILILIQTLQVIVPVLPGFLGCIVGAALFGRWGGFWCNYIGISLGSVIAFFLARRYGKALVKRMVSAKTYDSYAEKLRGKKGSYTLLLFLAILLPLAPDDFLCYFSGLTEMSSKRFVSIILAAKPWCILFYCFFTASLI